MNLGMILQLKYMPTVMNTPRIASSDWKSYKFYGLWYALSSKRGRWPPIFFYVFNLILSLSTSSQNFNKICTWEVLGANVLNMHIFLMFWDVITNSILTQSKRWLIKLGTCYKARQTSKEQTKKPRFRLEGPRHTLCMNYVTNTFQLVSSLVQSKQLLCFVQGQGRKS